jgi:hypothetical protein
VAKLLTSKAITDQIEQPNNALKEHHLNIKVDYFHTWNDMYFGDYIDLKHFHIRLTIRWRRPRLRRDLPGLQYDEDAGKTGEVTIWHGTRQFGCLTPAAADAGVRAAELIR